MRLATGNPDGCKMANFVFVITDFIINLKINEQNELTKRAQTEKYYILLIGSIGNRRKFNEKSRVAEALLSFSIREEITVLKR
jgi:hypothetical protein